MNISCLFGVQTYDLSLRPHFVVFLVDKNGIEGTGPSHVFLSALLNELNIC